jgi:hypothetical protein
MFMRVVFVAALASFLSCAYCFAAESQPLDNYYGWNRTHNMWANVALTEVQNGVTAFYQIHERWPTSWQEVTSSGLWNVPLRGYDNSFIDPDDRRCNSFGDLYYDGGSNPPKIHFWHVATGGNLIETVTLTAPETLHQRLLTIEARFSDTSILTALGDGRRPIVYGIETEIRRALPLYKDLYGNCPMTFADLLKSGLAPINESSVNPLTGKPYKGDGGANDFKYVYYPQSKTGTGSSSFLLYLVNADGSKPKVIFSL